MSVKKNYISKSTQYTVSYSGMRGVDFSSDNGKAKRYRFSYLENMYKDYSSGGDGIIESVPGFRKIASLGKKINAIYSHQDSNGTPYLVVHAGNSLFRFPLSEIDNMSSIVELAGIEDTKSHGFTLGSDLYILDGRNILKISSDGTCSSILSNQSNSSPYVPTTYYNGVEYEQRNLLTEKFQEKYVISAAGDIALESEGIVYNIISNEDFTVGVASVKASMGGVLYIPSYTYISGVKYKVIEISNNAFYSNSRITAVTLSDTVKRIGKAAFAYCTYLRRVVCRSSIEIIDDNAFYGCTALNTLHLGVGLKELGSSVFTDCSVLKTINYEGTEAMFQGIKNNTVIGSITVNYLSVNKSIVVEIPLFSPANFIERVTLDGDTVLYSTKIKDSIYTAITISSDDRNTLDGKEVVIYGKTSESKFTMNSTGTNFLSEQGSSITGSAAILGCTVCECFDGRVFLSGNPKLPNTVFYSARDNTGRNNPLYFGILNYFNDGTGNFTVKSMLATGDSLVVFKSGDDGGGSIFYHTGKETGADIMPKIYPVSYVHSGISALGESISFFDDPLFLSSLGCTALDKRTINLERSITTRSNNINARLLTEDLSSISVTKWCGYLVLQAGEHIYLADSRDMFTNEQGGVEYEWYYLSGIGTYKEDRRIFRYSEFAKEGYSVLSSRVNEEVEGGVYLTMTEANEPVYYTTENGVNYEVYTDGERRGGDFSPASCVHTAEGDLLFFGTESGDLCVFNNDKRGVAPIFLSEQSDFNPEEYAVHYGRRIHPYFYNFDWHAPRYALKTVSDDGGVPNFTKNTVKHSLVVKVRCIGNGSVICEVGTEKGGYKEIAELPDSALNFAEFDFENLSFANIEYATLALRERERGWIEKNVAFYSEKYSSPFGIYAITYRFSIKGKIKQ